MGKENGAISKEPKTVIKMTRKEAYNQMRKGVKVTHRYFSDNEWMTIENGKVKTEDGYLHDYQDFMSWRKNEDGWHDGYSIYRPEENLGTQEMTEVTC